MGRQFTRLVRILSLVALVTAFGLTAGTVGSATTVVSPNSTNMLDCNGWSNVYRSVKPNMRSLCTDPFAIINGKPTRFFDNNYYVGHDEPSVKFISSAPGSASNMTYFMQLAVDPAAAPTANGSVTDYAELSAAPWFGLPICDPNSYPQNRCAPASDTNTGTGATTDAGSAFEELQFYAPGFGPFQDAFSCDQMFYCAALTIDSLECTFGFRYCNRACIEPVNFAYIQTDGVPAGPPSPQLLNEASFHPNAHTLLMKQGDALKVSLQDTPDGLRTSIADLTTGQSGFMVASAANGFMNTNLRTCSGTPFSFHPEYSTASQQNQVPWAALEGGVLMQDEIGHFEPCTSVTNPLGLSYDPQTAQTCNGGVEPNGTGEGPCSVTGCQNSTTEGGGPCPRGGLCENADALCAPSGARSVTLLGKSETWSWPVAACEQDWFQNGDLDFDGTGYIADWPDGSANHPTPFRYNGPFDAAGKPYPSIQIETDLGGSEQDCNVVSGSGCTVPPHGASFYPYWTIGNQATPFSRSGQKVCLWNFGNTIAGVTTNNLGAQAEYGTPDVARYAGTIISPVMANPQLNARC